MVCIENKNSIKIDIDNLKFSKLYIEVSGKCNLECIHCFNRSGMNNNFSVDLDDIKKAIDKGCQHGVEEVFISGGEPLLRKDILDILDYCRFKNLKIMLLTNGTIINDEQIDYLISNNIQVQVTLNGSCEEVDSLVRGKGFNKTIDFIKKFVDKNGAKLIKTTTTINKINKDDIEQLVKMCSELGVKKIQFAFISKEGRAKENYDKLILSFHDKVIILRELTRIKDVYSDVSIVTSGMYQTIKNLSGDVSYSYSCSNITKELTVRSNLRLSFCDKIDSYLQCNNINYPTLDDFLNKKYFEIEKISYEVKCKDCTNYVCLGRCMDGKSN